MSPEQAEKMQIEIYQKIGEEGRLKIAFELYELVRNALKEMFREENPGISEEELSRKVAKRLSAK